MTNRGPYRIKDERWILKRRLYITRSSASCRKAVKRCDTKRCKNQAVSVWYSNKRVEGNEWHTCEKCQQNKWFRQWLNQPQLPERRTRIRSLHCQQGNLTQTKRVLGTIKIYQPKLEDPISGKNRNCWSKARELWSIPVSNMEPKIGKHAGASYSYELKRGGTLKLYPNLLNGDHLKLLGYEAKNCGFFRHYQTQGQDEPRLHCLLHEDATDDFGNDQPGYKYANIKSKARPLQKLPILHAFSKRAATLCGVTSWNIGAQLVLYRGKRDSMGEHADDDQGERVILCVVASSPKRPRRVRIVPQAKGDDLKANDECIELFLSEGDAYEMDGEMQKNYFHSVPKTSSDAMEDSDRLCIVFRAGNNLTLSKDSGRPCIDLKLKEQPPKIFGRTIPGLEEGQVYRRTELFHMGAHQSWQSGISGNMDLGAGAIIVSGKRQDGLESDSFENLTYAAERSIGALAMVKNYKLGLPVRVFRSSEYKSKYRAVAMNKYSTVYRYDGLYTVVYHCRPTTSMGAHVFHLQRVREGSGKNMNALENSAHLWECMVRRTLRPDRDWQALFQALSSFVRLTS